MNINLESEMYKRVEKNLTLKNIKINKQVALRAIETVNSKTPLTVAMIKEVMKLGKV
ncbi:hypothetical protein MKX47_17215 [Solibacillus sp. FSL R7-0668]|uniref:hypothetical protein n=1 Tax=Solibacillus sp. FSL R7-0668 TaxID=2921688 RepID=UPI0030FCFB89